ncbi:MAG: hypothetical protein HY986_05765 [Candidatus Melainabacteria bacterium]|nr:hypothetical protein [Candidatus Melainabacteria bacterium]
MPIVLTLAVAQTCLAFEARFYPSFPNRDPLHAEVFAALAKASVTIECLGADEIDVSIGEYCKEGGSYKPIYFTKNQIYLFLKKQKDKRLLAVWFLKPIMNLSNVKIQEILKDYKAFLADLGYERVLILGAAASGVYVVYDSEQAVPLSKIEGNKLQNKE